MALIISYFFEKSSAIFKNLGRVRGKVGNAEPHRGKQRLKEACMTQENRGLGQILGVPRVQGTKGCGATPPSIQSVKRPICQSVNFALPHPRSPGRSHVEGGMEG